MPNPSTIEHALSPGVRVVPGYIARPPLDVPSPSCGLPVSGAECWARRRALPECAGCVLLREQFAQLEAQFWEAKWLNDRLESSLERDEGRLDALLAVRELKQRLRGALAEVERLTEPDPVAIVEAAERAAR